MDRLRYLIDYLVDEYDTNLTQVEYDFDSFRRLVNVRQPKEISDEFLRIQDEYLSAISREKGIVEVDSIPTMTHNMCVWQGDITRLNAEAIVNAANKGLIGCFYPGHHCVDNEVHTYAGVQLRLACSEMMKSQGHDEPIGGAKITEAYNLPANYIIHTVGPIIGLSLYREEEEQLRCCYRSILELAYEMHLDSVAICCISTGEFHFPNHRACEIAIETVKEIQEKYDDKCKVIFNVFKDVDYYLYCDKIQHYM